MSLWLPEMGDASLVDFNSAIPHGCKRCTTKKSNWYLKPELFTNGDSIFEEFYPCDITEAPQSPITDDANNENKEYEFEGSGMEGQVKKIEVSSTRNEDLNTTVKTRTCEATDVRRYHLYRLLNINAILIVVDPPERPQKFDGTRKEWSDGPIEGNYEFF